MTIVTIKENASEPDESNQQTRDLQSTVASLTTMVESLRQDNESLRNALKIRDETIEALTRQLNKSNNNDNGCCILSYTRCFRKAPSQKQLEESTKSF